MSNAASAQIQPAQLDAPAKPARFVINAEVEGFPVVVEVEGKADALKTMIDRLKAIGATPPTPRPGAKTDARSGAPVCPVHNSSMKPSRKPGKFYCAKKAEDGEYCRETA
jgi:hypothetical protein